MCYSITASLASRACAALALLYSSRFSKSGDEYEMDCKANGYVNGLSIKGADISGGSFRSEIDATMKAEEKSP